jgi:dTDP-4-dehydrorhamnose reductase
MAVADPRRILITGSSGFVGRHLLPLLDVSFPGVEIFTNRTDVTNREGLIQAGRDAQPDAYPSCCDQFGPSPQRDPELSWRVNLHGTLHTAKPCSSIPQAAICCLRQAPKSTADHSEKASAQ